MLLKPLAGSGPTLSKHPFVHRNIIVRNVWRVAQKSYRIEHFGRVETHVAFFCVPRFLHTSNGFSMILTHVKCDFGCHGAKWSFSHRFCKQNWNDGILCPWALEELEGAPGCIDFDVCFKTPARIKISRRDTAFCALAAVALQLCFLRQRDLETAQVTFFEKCENLSKIKGNHSKWSIYGTLKHQNIQNQPRIISKSESLKITQFDQLPRTHKWWFMTVPTFALKAQRRSKFSPFRPC